MCSFDLKPYYDSILALEQYIDDIDSRCSCKADMINRRKLAEDELCDLYAIVNHFEHNTNSVFPDVYKVFDRVSSYEPFGN